jgi:hypothetical protein
VTVELSADPEREVIIPLTALSADPERTVVIPITRANQGGATDGDYSGVPSDVTFSSGETSKTLTFAATDDSVDDDGESIRLGFGTLPAKVTEGSPDETTVSITDNDVAGVTVSPTTVTVAEGETATYQVKLNTLPTGTVIVTINDPTDNTDVTADTASLSFDSANWDTFQDVTVRAAEDGDAEDDTATRGRGRRRGGRDGDCDPHGERVRDGHDRRQRDGDGDGQRARGGGELRPGDA